MNIKSMIGYVVDDINLGEFSSVDDMADARPKQRLSELSMGTSGFGPVFPGVSGMPVIEVGSFEFFRISFEERKPDSSVIRNLLNAAIEKAKEEGRELNKKERRELKSNITDEVTRKTLPKLRSTLAAFEKSRSGYGRLFVFATSDKKAEEVITLVRDVLMSAGGSIRVIPAIGSVDIQSVLTKWIADPKTLPSDVTLGLSAKFESPNRERTSIDNTELPCEQSQTAISNGQRCVKLEFSTEKLFASLNMKGLLSGIKPTETLAAQIDQETVNDDFDELNIYSATLLMEIDAAVELYDTLTGALK